MREWVELFDELQPEVSPWPFGRFGVAGLEENLCTLLSGGAYCVPETL